ncbi:peptide-n4-n-acetyl-beta-glucosaminylasparagine amidase a [Trichoderma arundinaceum]|uniref:Peptide-n4-n-acetyl-beta-glucosaminylasparagine amidase a n=1 Tax=Trichoderma arundinaceum TaxID=490622 RepID=A0A395N9X3_TRIAR|nr:peptide-n4-n-acetyl-beta-glucosaminylasparagine amidase a [Trichoderma arundinaceum]
MLSVYPSEIQYQQHLSHSPIRPMPHRQPEVSLGFASMSASRHSHHHHSSKAAAAQQHQAQQDAAVAQALEIARESPDGASDPTVSKILELALSQIWSKVQAQPDSYVMTRDEFAVFNFFQHRFTGDKMAVTARKRYWDHARA